VNLSERRSLQKIPVRSLQFFKHVRKLSGESLEAKNRRTVTILKKSKD